MVKCMMCGGDFKESPDNLVMCGHHRGPVHMGCCVNNCSGQKMPCEHSQAVFKKEI